MATAIGTGDVVGEGNGVGRDRSSYTFRRLLCVLQVAGRQELLDWNPRSICPFVWRAEGIVRFAAHRIDLTECMEWCGRGLIPLSRNGHSMCHRRHIILSLFLAPKISKPDTITIDWKNCVRKDSCACSSNHCLTFKGTHVDFSDFAL